MTPLSFDAPSPANPREYLHKPYIARNCVPWAISVALQIFEQFCPKVGNANPLVAEPETQRKMTIQGHSRSSISVSLKSH